MWQDRLLHCVVFTKTSEEFAPHYLAGIRHDMRQTTIQSVTHYRRFSYGCDLGPWKPGTDTALHPLPSHHTLYSCFSTKRVKI